MNGEEIAADWVGTLENGGVALKELNEAVAAEGTAEKLEEVKAMLLDGSLKVFDTATFTVHGAKLTTYFADVDTDELMLATIQASSGVMDFLVDFFENSIIIPDGQTLA